MLAFVLGGGGTRGAAQAGAIRALLERGIVPDMLVGTSAGSINAAHMALYPTLEGAKTLETSWRKLTPETLVGSSKRSVAWRTVRGKPSLYSSEGLREFLDERTPDGITFGQTPAELYIVASELYSGKSYIFGDRPREHVLDAIMASTAIPPYFPPVSYNSVVLVDGSVTSTLPLRIAIHRGATEIYAIDISLNPPRPRPPTKLRLWTVSELSVGAMLRKQVHDEITWARLQPAVTLHHIKVPFVHSSGTWDLEAVDDYIELGYKHCATYLVRHGLPYSQNSVYRSVAQVGGLVRRGTNAVFRGLVRGPVYMVRRMTFNKDDGPSDSDEQHDAIDDEI